MSGIVSEMKKCPYLEDCGSKKIFISIFFRKKANFYHFSPDITAECTFYNRLSLFLIRPIYADLENLISANKSPYLLIFCLKMIKYPIFKGKIRFWYFIHPPISWKSSIYRFSDNPGHNVLRILLNLH